MAVKEYREKCLEAVAEQLATSVQLPEHPRIELQFYPPDHRRYDQDNLLARAKAGIDALFKHLGSDDYHLRSILVRPAGGPVRRGALWIRIVDDPDALAFAELAQ